MTINQGKSAAGWKARARITSAAATAMQEKQAGEAQCNGPDEDRGWGAWILIQDLLALLTSSLVLHRGHAFGLLTRVSHA